MSYFIQYAGLNFDFPPNKWRVKQWRKLTKFFTVWLGDAVDAWLDRLMPEAPNAWDLDQAQRDLKISSGHCGGEMIVIINRMSKKGGNHGVSR